MRFLILILITFTLSFASIEASFKNRVLSINQPVMVIDRESGIVHSWCFESITIKSLKGFSGKIKVISPTGNINDLCGNTLSLTQSAKKTVKKIESPIETLAGLRDVLLQGDLSTSQMGEAVISSLLNSPKAMSLLKKQAKAKGMKGLDARSLLGEVEEDKPDLKLLRDLARLWLQDNRVSIDP